MHTTFEKHHHYYYMYVYRTTKIIRLNISSRARGIVLFELYRVKCRVWKKVLRGECNTIGNVDEKLYLLRFDTLR